MVFGSIEIRRCLTLLFALAFSLAAIQSTPAFAQQEPQDEPAAAATDEETEEPEAEPDPFAVPEEATVPELFQFINDVKRRRGNNLQSVMKAAKAAAAAADKIRKTDGVELDDELKAIREQLSALTFVSRYDQEAKASMEQLLEELEQDDRPEIQRFAAAEAFKVKISSAQSASKEEQQALIAEWKRIVGDQLDREGYALGNSLARAIGYSDNAEVAANMYEELAAMMSVSDDDMLKGRADKMLGAARRMRLPGNFMEVMGTTTDGEVFDWDAYRGKVVLVDFWASWCGPCRAEVPNMKRNLAGYQPKGFEIVGVNLDNTLAACEKYVAQEDLSWPNIFSDNEGERGWDNPLATHYGITGIPTAVLVDQEGKVVSLRARGSELDRLLQEMLGDPIAPPEDSENDSEENADDSDDEE